MATVEKFVKDGGIASRTVERRVASIVTWEERRDLMKGACINCHSPTYVDNFYRQFDDLVILYNNKFARPAKELMDELQADGVLRAEAPFEHRVQWVFWELWHHEGRRARHGASMMGPDYTHWHGTYEIAKHFYTKMIPELEELIEKGKQSDDEEKVKVAEALEKKLEEVMNDTNHAWYSGNLSPEELEERKKRQEEFKKRYE